MVWKYRRRYCETIKNGSLYYYCTAGCRNSLVAFSAKAVAWLADKSDLPAFKTLKELLKPRDVHRNRTFWKYGIWQADFRINTQGLLALEKSSPQGSLPSTLMARFDYGTRLPKRPAAGDQILLEARIVGVADVVEAMSSHRPYRPGRGASALQEIEQG